MKANSARGLRFPHGSLLACWSLVALLCVPFVQAQKAAQPWLTPQQRTDLDALFAASARPDTPGYALGIIQDGHLVVAQGYGQANLDDQVPITPQTSFHLASVSKQFTAAAIALLLQSGEIRLSDPVSKYIPETAKYGPQLTLAHLVYMTSGLHEYTDVPRDNGVPWVTFFYFTRDDAIHSALKPDTLEFAPGTKWAYRNINFMLLTKVVEAVSHQSFPDFMQQRIFAPLGMTHTLIDDDSTVIIPHRAIGYARRDDPRVAQELAGVGVQIKPGAGWVRLNRVSPHFGGSGVFSTLDDLALWDANWYSGKLGPGFTAQMNQTMKFQHDKDNDAFGLVWRELYGHKLLDYSGGDTDTSTYMVRFPDRHLSVIVLANDPLGDAEGKAHQVEELLHTWGRL